MYKRQEQASFETERRFCRENGNQAGAYGEVLSFTRLENRVLSQTGGGADPVLDEGGRLLAMYAALKSVQDHLTVYACPPGGRSSWTASSPPWTS